MAGLFGGYKTREAQIQGAISDEPKKKAKAAPPKKAKPKAAVKKKKPIWMMNQSEYNAYMKNRK